MLELGADVLEIPTIRIVPPTERHVIAEVLLELNSYDWLVFTSPNGVAAFFEFFFKVFEDLRDIGGVRIAAVGPATAAKLTRVASQSGCDAQGVRRLENRRGDGRIRQPSKI